MSCSSRSIKSFYIERSVKIQKLFAVGSAGTAGATSAIVVVLYFALVTRPALLDWRTFAVSLLPMARAVAAPIFVFALDTVVSIIFFDSFINFIVRRFVFNETFV